MEFLEGAQDLRASLIYGYNQSTSNTKLLLQDDNHGLGRSRSHMNHIETFGEALESIQIRVRISIYTTPSGK